ncbi:MAG: 3'(2'),5'-bisphosphate nucleotidase CysQ [Crocinitomicaceae bacterium]|nr:3'(2'),5'-bisphosphate nucleotidase CysQ [Crocinitomicaceae bacterium]MDG1775977.1 3'(2'),5'-bisphosphate nucleotidase CysQ [Crocinitomicaceae bacterium]
MLKKELLSTAIEASLKAGKAIMEIYESDDFGVEVKGDNSPLTRADLAADKIIQTYLVDTGIPILSEEGKGIPYENRKDWKQLWIVDPIDGTKEFIKKNGEFTVNIALIEEQKTVLGVVYAPALNELYFSSKEGGSFKIKNAEELDVSSILSSASSLPLQVEKENYTVVASRSHMSPETEDYVAEMRKKHGEVELISKGSSLKIVMVAEGTADCYPRFAPTMEWDTAAGQAICEHAGFDVIDWKTKNTMKYNREKLLNNWFLVK